MKARRDDVTCIALVKPGFKGHFIIVTKKRDLDLSVAFYESRADGKYLSLASYLGRASYMADRSHRALLQPGVPHALVF